MSKPILVCMSWRGGARFERCLASIARAKEHFSRIVLSVTSAEDSDDMVAALAFRDAHPGIEVICTGMELPTMEHQAFWVEHLQRTGAQPNDWIYWLAYDDEVRSTGIAALVDDSGDWPLEADTVYFGPWAMRHEQPDHLWSGDPSDPLESWTSFPQQGPLRLPVMEWIAEQLRQPTYMQMSGSVCPLANFVDVRDGRPRKRGPMRIEMAVAASGSTTHVAEFNVPVSTIYGRSDSDRATYGKQARKEDLHLMGWLARYTVTRPSQWASLVGLVSRASLQQVTSRMTGRTLPTEEWRVRGTVAP